jgi:hypothetical protein
MEHGVKLRLRGDYTGLGLVLTAAP